MTKITVEGDRVCHRSPLRETFLMEEEIVLRLRHPQVRFCILTVSFVCLVGALIGGLVRLGWGDYYRFLGELPGYHGPMIVCGFVGTFFSLERAVTMGHFGSYLAPLLTGLGALALVVWPSTKLGPELIAVGSCAFFLISLIILIRKFAPFSLFICLGSFQWLMGNLIWLARWPVYNVTLWWMSFVVLTTAGERLEIAQMMHIDLKSKVALFIGLGAVFIGHILAAVGHLAAPDNLMDVFRDALFDPRIKLGMMIAGLGMVTASAWFLIYDPARSRLREAGMAGYVAVCMVSSYLWLAFSGIFSVIFAGLASGTGYDSFTHSFFLGFLMFMVFGHGPIIVPSMLGLFLKMRKYFYVSPILLNASLLLRIFGDMGHSLPLREWGGMLNAVAIACFILTLLLTILADNRPMPSLQDAAGR